MAGFVAVLEPGRVVTRRPTTGHTLCCLLLIALAGCSRPAEVARDAAPAPAQPAQKGTVILGENAPELRQMTIEKVNAVSVPSDTVTAPAKIEANPNRIGHAMLPTPGRVVRVMVKLGDSVEKGQPLVTIESAHGG